MLEGTTAYSTMFALENNSPVSNLRQIRQVQTTRQAMRMVNKNLRDSSFFRPTIRKIAITCSNTTQGKNFS
jgi:tRNA U38,U39,U40 pseudouridine synthase TruA